MKPASALKGGDNAHSRRRLMHALVAAQVAFCFLVHFAAGLFVSTFDRLSNQPTGFSAERLLTLDVVTPRAQSRALWGQVAEHLRSVPGVETVALCEWPLFEGGSWNGFVFVNGQPVNNTLAYFLSVSPGWIEAMKIPLLDGRDFRPGDTFPGVAIVNEAFVRQYFNGANPIGKLFEKSQEGKRPVLQIVGVVRDARYRNMREPITPTAYVPFQRVDSAGAVEPARRGTFIVRTANANPLAMASMLRREIPRALPEFRVSNIRTQTELIQRQTVRERLLAMLALFFAVVALLLAGVGLYGVLDYLVLQRRREIGIRLAIGAHASRIVRLVTVEVFSMVLVGALVGIALGFGSARYVEALLYHVKVTDLGAVALPAVTILAVTLLAALPPVIRAIRIDPAKMLRAE